MILGDVLLQLGLPRAEGASRNCRLFPNPFVFSIENE